MMLNLYDFISGAMLLFFKISQPIFSDSSTDLLMYLNKTIGLSPFSMLFSIHINGFEVFLMNF